MQLVSILGPYHCGSTALCCMLGKHPDCFAVGETYRIAHHLKKYKAPKLGYRCSCQNGQLQCKFWEHVSNKVNGFDRNVFKVVSNLSESEVIIDDSKLPRELTPYLGDFPVKVIHLSKSPERYAASCLRYREINRRSLSVDDVMGQWVKHNQNVFNFSGERIHQKFIKLVDNCEPALERLCNFIGIEYVEGMQDYWENKEHHILGGNTKVIVSYKDINNFDKVDQSRWDWCNKNFAEFKRIFRRRFSENFNPNAWKNRVSKKDHESIWDNVLVRQMATRLGYEKLEL